MLHIPPQPAGLPSGSFGGHRRSASPWSWRRLLAAPHRLAFWGGSVLLALSALWWAAALVARHAGLNLPWAVSPTTAHALLMAFGFLPLFITGFLTTAGPKWLGLGAVPGHHLVLPVAGVLAGWAAALAGFHLSRPLAALGVVSAPAVSGGRAGRA